MSPKIAGIESSANSRSVDPIATITTSIGVIIRRPATRTNERRSVELRGHRQHAAHQAQHGVLRELVLVVDALPGHVDRRHDQDGREQVEHPAERLDGGRTDGDERSAHHQGDDDADEEHPVLVLRGNPERGQDEDEHEQVVDRQRVLRDVPGEELPGRHSAGERPQADAEQHGQRDVEQHPPGGLARGHRVRLVVHEEQVGQNDRDQTTDGGQPEPQQARSYGVLPEEVVRAASSGPRSLPSTRTKRTTTLAIDQ